MARELDDGHSSKAKLQHVMAAMSFGGTVKQFAQQYAIACCDDSATWTHQTGTPWVELDEETYTLEQIQAAYVFAHIDKAQEGTISKHELTEFLTDPNVVFPQVSFGESEYKSPEDVFAKIVSFRRKGLKFDTKGNCISGDCEGGITPQEWVPSNLPRDVYSVMPAASDGYSVFKDVTSKSTIRFRSGAAGKMCIGGNQYNLDADTDRKKLEKALNVGEHPESSGSKYLDAASVRDVFNELDTHGATTDDGANTGDGFLTIDDVSENSKLSEETKTWLAKHFARDSEIDIDEFFLAVGPQPWLSWSESNKFGWGCPCGDGTFPMLKELRPEWAKLIDPNEANIGTVNDNHEDNAAQLEFPPRSSKGLIEPVSKISPNKFVTDKLWNFGVDYITATDAVEQEEKRLELKALLHAAKKGGILADMFLVKVKQAMKERAIKDAIKDAKQKLGGSGPETEC